MSTPLQVCINLLLWAMIAVDLCTADPAALTPILACFVVDDWQALFADPQLPAGITGDAGVDNHLRRSGRC